MDVAVLGAGSWGTALAILLARNGHAVRLLGRDAEELGQMQRLRENRRYLPGFELPPNVSPEPLALIKTDVCVVAVPAASILEVLRRSEPEADIAVIASKGLEFESGRLLTDVAADLLPATRIGALSGPNLAIEITRGIPTVAIAASAETAVSEAIRDAFTCQTFRVSITDDLVGVEIAGALKNVLAIGAGMSDGLGFGDNTKGAFLSRGLMEMSRLGLAMGGRMETFLGPAGVGDLFATAVSRLSRNYRCGRALGEGHTLAQALEALGQVAEGVPTSHATMVLAQRHQVEMPVFAAVNAVIEGRMKPLEAVQRLMDRRSNMKSFLPETHNA